MNRRTFLISSGAAGLGALLAAPEFGHTAETDSRGELFLEYR